MLSGVVSDAVTSEVIEGAKIIVRLPDVKGKKGEVADTESFDDGRFAINNLDPRDYILEVKAKKYWPYKEEIDLGIGNSEKDISLAPKGGKGKFTEALSGLIEFVKGFFSNI